MTSPSTRFPVVVAGRRDLAAGVVGLTLARADGGSLPEWGPGAHVDVEFPAGLRQYSLCGDPVDLSVYDIAVLLELDGRGGSAHLHALRVGDPVTISAPRNHFPFTDADRYVFVAGGIGITPLLPMLTEATRRGVPWTLTYGGRTAAAMALAADLKGLGEHVTLWPEDELGLLPLPALLADPGPGTALYTCGPGGLLDAVEIGTAHWPAGSVHLERFVPRQVVTSDDRSFRVRLAQRGTVHTVPAGRSILDVLKADGVPVTTSCEVGTCGTCEATVLAGRPEHRDSVLTAEDRAEGRYLMLCVSRSETDELVLDL